VPGIVRVFAYRSIARIGDEIAYAFKFSPQSKRRISNPRIRAKTTRSAAICGNRNRGRYWDQALTGLRALVGLG
jgi:hypothetical protein